MKLEAPLQVSEERRKTLQRAKEFKNNTNNINRMLS
jgi:hypothetical protein